MLITSKDNNKIKEIRKLYDKKYSMSKNLFVIEGENLVEEALKNNKLVELYALDGTNVKYNFEYNTVSEEVMKSISSLKSTPRLIGVSKYITKNEIGNRIVILDDVQDPGNVGTIIRNCAAFNIDTLIVSKNTANVYSDKVLRSTGGMIYNINIVIDDIESQIKELKQNNIKIYGTSLSKSKSLKNMQKTDKFAIIFGNEGNGVKKELLDLCDEIIRIDMDNKCESLNVGVSTGIILYHMYEE